MRNLFRGVVAVTVVAAVAACANSSASARSRITELHEIEVIPGANKIDKLVADGRSGLITEGWRDLGGARGYRIYSIMIPNTNALRGWDIVPIEPGPEDATTQERSEIAGSVRFARGWLDGTPTTFLITAARDAAAPADAGKPGKMGFEVYRLVTARTGDLSENAFEPVLHMVSKGNFCNPDLALAREFKLDLPRTYTGINDADGCPAGAS